MTDKIRVGILFGGKSAEHEVSLQSAKNVVEAIDKGKYEIVLIGIDKSGKWYLNDASRFLLNADNPKLVKLSRSTEEIALIQGDREDRLINVTNGKPECGIDVIFPVLHGTYGEDGTVQGLLKLTDIPFVGAGVLGSAVGMDKDVMKRLLRDAGLPIANFLAYRYSEKSVIDYEDVTGMLGTPLFVKPANLGSSVGISKVKSAAEFEDAVNEAFRFDTKILIEESIAGREIECSVLGNQNPIASVPGEVMPQHEFYSYEAKYIDEKGATLQIPAKLSDELVVLIQNLALRAFTVLCCEGMARVDFFLTEENNVIVNEINTIPGFTKISMYPKLWDASGISYTELIDRLIQLAIERHEREKALATSYSM
ncbi:MAG: D-alanine--D-alanine ligase [candidate division KSB1 bacterium]|jgi:D-alanine-D-alanine ligase|nr:D-alanine--D-alanine ligase [candidate division KSB1 bacterium]